VGPGFAYHVGAALGSFTPTLIGALKDRDVMLNLAMALFIAVSNFLVIALMWAGPETRGVQFTGDDKT
jgi:cyanate permease